MIRACFDPHFVSCWQSVSFATDRSAPFNGKFEADLESLDNLDPQALADITRTVQGEMTQQACLQSLRTAC